MADAPVIEVQGLRKFRNDLGAMSRDYRKGLDKSLKESAKPIVDDAKSDYRRQHPRRSGSRGSQRGMRAAAAAGKVRVVLGAGKYPYLLGQEFGSSKWPQFPKPNKKGYFFWPAIRKGTKKLYKDIERVVDDANKRHFEG